jgi:hypothetical protein
MVHITPSHAGLRAAGTHAVAWQQPAGTQSLSVAHSAPSGSAAASAIAVLPASLGAGQATPPASAVSEPPLLTLLFCVESVVPLVHQSNELAMAATAVSETAARPKRDEG